MKALINCWEAEKCPEISEEKMRDSIDRRVDNAADSRSGTRLALRSAIVDERGEASGVNVQGMEQRTEADNRRNEPPRGGSTMQTGERSVYSPGLSGLMKAYTGRQKYTGGWDEDLLGTVEVYEMACRMCELDKEEI